ncbi:MAG: hypothetical protein QHH07_02985 [Sedimentisphaerales bacterium]|nr:hypothetical protein [Sedimentisphaerales bacterium]
MAQKIRDTYEGPTLLVMAAGMGSRYGGLKQIDPIGPNGEWILDYSLYDAIAAGFKKAVFIIRKDFERAFRDRIEANLAGRIQTAFVCQELDSLVPPERIPPDRKKPWGTGHAVLVARDVVTGPFAVINSDDYYGSGTYRMIKKLLHKMTNSDGHQQIMIGYRLRNTLSEHGGVTRGICQCDGDGYLIGITEQKGLEMSGQDAIVRQGDSVIRFPGDTIVSMNFWGYHPRIFNAFDALFQVFINEQVDAQQEFLLPTIINTLVKQGMITVKVIPTDEGWFGVTYKQDKDAAVERIKDLIRLGRYPRDLWSRP